MTLALSKPLIQTTSMSDENSAICHTTSPHKLDTARPSIDLLNGSAENVGHACHQRSFYQNGLSRIPPLVPPVERPFKCEGFHSVTDDWRVGLSLFRQDRRQKSTRT